MKKIGKANKVYLAYGSNLNWDQMRHRCPYAVPLGRWNCPGYRLLFRRRNGGAVATVEPDDGGGVPALLWEITPRDEEALDRYEGWPHFYRKETVKVAVGRKSEEAMVYIMNGGHHLGLPGAYYLEVVREGYASAGFDPDVLEKAMRDSEGQEKSEEHRDCLACSNSFSEPAERDDDPDRLFCMERQAYVAEDDSCGQFK